MCLFKLLPSNYPQLFPLSFLAESRTGKCVGGVKRGKCVCGVKQSRTLNGTSRSTRTTHARTIWGRPRCCTRVRNKKPTSGRNARWPSIRTMVQPCTTSPVTTPRPVKPTRRLIVSTKAAFTQSPGWMSIRNSIRSEMTQDSKRSLGDTVTRSDMACHP